MATEERSLYEKLGGEKGLRDLVADFYSLMDSLPEVQGIRGQHQKNLAEAREKLFMFLSGWTGGPSLYIEQFGHPRLRARHLPFQIGITERDQWLFCLWTALEKTALSKETITEFKNTVARLADHMRNIEEPLPK